MGLPIGLPLGLPVGMHPALPYEVNPDDSDRWRRQPMLRLGWVLAATAEQQQDDSEQQYRNRCSLFTETLKT